MTILALLKSNEEQRTIAEATTTEVLGEGWHGLWITVTFPELRTVERILQVEFDTDPEMWLLFSGWIQDKAYGESDGLAADNIVGMSIYLAIGSTVTATHGTSLTTRCIVLGF